MGDWEGFKCADCASNCTSSHDAHKPQNVSSLGDNVEHLCQGVTESRVLEDADGQKYMLVLVSRRSRLHPGTRYIARGLNSLASPGNEIECEQVTAFTLTALNPGF